jgi:hypothetical protein
MKTVEKLSLTFGRIVIDKLHRFFGESDPSACVIVGVWSSEDDDKEVMIDHFRGFYEEKYSNLRNPDRYYITNKFVDVNMPILEQLKEAENEYKLQVEGREGR